MKTIGLSNTLIKGFEVFKERYELENLFNEVNFFESDVLSIEFSNKKLNLGYKHLSDIFFGLGLVIQKKQDFSLKVSKRVERLTYMVDVSRNAVLKVETIKKLVEYLAFFGYSSLQLYTEDTFEMENEPYFGYMRGAYTKQEIKEIETYAANFGLELVPCIQTLAHLNGIKRYGAYSGLFDTADILLVEDDKTYELIEKMIKTSHDNFGSKYINIGMDEAYMLGRGRYLDKHGLVPRFDIMVNHLKRVLEICKKYGYTPMMWSDMFFRMAMTNYYDDSGIPKEFLDKVPSDVELIYWDYYRTEEAHYLKNLDKHLQFNNPINFAGGVWKWIGFTPSNRFSQTAAYVQMKAITQKGIKHFMVTSWGDNGNEASAFSVLPSIAYYGYLTYFDSEVNDAFKSFFEGATSVSFDRFMLVDLANYLSNNVKDLNSANKHFLYNDILLGLMDTAVEKKYPSMFKKYANQIFENLGNFGEFEYLFYTQYKLLNTLSKKVMLGVLLREAYKEKDITKLKKLVSKLKSTVKALDQFHETFETQWSRENKAFGYEIQDLRIGGIRSRMLTAIEKVSAYINGELELIEELEVDLLDYYGGYDKYNKVKHIVEYRYLPLVSVGVNV